MDIRFSEPVQFKRMGRDFRIVFPQPLPSGVESVSCDMELFVGLYRELAPMVAEWESGDHR